MTIKGKYRNRNQHYPVEHGGYSRVAHQAGPGSRWFPWPIFVLPREFFFENTLVIFIVLIFRYFSPVLRLARPNFLKSAGVDGGYSPASLESQEELQQNYNLFTEERKSREMTSPVAKLLLLYISPFLHFRPEIFHFTFSNYFPNRKDSYMFS
jgi:hypothetical protein